MNFCQSLGDIYGISTHFCNEKILDLQKIRKLSLEKTEGYPRSWKYQFSNKSLITNPLWKKKLFSEIRYYEQWKDYSRRKKLAYFELCSIFLRILSEIKSDYINVKDINDEKSERRHVFFDFSSQYALEDNPIQTIFNKKSSYFCILLLVNFCRRKHYKNQSEQVERLIHYRISWHVPIYSTFLWKIFPSL